MTDRRRAATALALFLGIVTAHSLVMAHVFPGTQPFAKYPFAAGRLLDGQLGPERLLDYSPLYLYLHAGAERLFDDPLAVVQLLQSVMVALTGALLYLTLSARVSGLFALAGALVFALDPGVLVYEKVLEPECLLMFLVMGFLYFSDRGRSGDALAAGSFFGLAFLTRANFVLLLPAVPAYYWFSGGGERSRVRRSLLFLVPVVLCISFLWVRNASTTGYFVPYAANPGYIFFEGNNPTSAGRSATYPPLVEKMRWEEPGEADYAHEVYRTFAREATGKGLSVVEVNRYWREKALSFIVDHPGHFMEMVLLKARLFFHDYRRHDLSDAYGLEQQLAGKPIPSLPFWILSALALCGLALNRRYWQRDLLFYGMLAVQFTALLLFYVSERQRLAVLPVFVFFAVLGLSRLRFSLRGSLPFLAALPLAFVFFSAETDLMREEKRQYGFDKAVGGIIEEVRRHRQERNLEGAARHAARAFALAPGIDEVIRPAGLRLPRRAFADFAFREASGYRGEPSLPPFNLALLHVAAGRYGEGEEILKTYAGEGRNLYRNYRGASEPRYYLGRIEEMRGNHDEALAWFEEGITRSPGSPYLLSHLYALTGEDGYRMKLERYFGEIDAAYLVGKALLNVGRGEEAAQHFAYVTGKVPGFRRGLIYLAVALGSAGKYEEAAGHYIEAMGIRMEPVFREEEILTIFEEWTRMKPDDLDARYFHGVVLHQFGHYREALDVQEEVVKRYPGEQAVQEEILELRRILFSLEREKEALYPPEVPAHQR